MTVLRTPLKTVTDVRDCFKGKPKQCSNKGPTKDLCSQNTQNNKVKKPLNYDAPNCFLRTPASGRPLETVGDVPDCFKRAAGGCPECFTNTAPGLRQSGGPPAGPLEQSGTSPTVLRGLLPAGVGKTVWGVII